MSVASAIRPPPSAAGISLGATATFYDIEKSEGPLDPVADTPTVDYEPFLPDKKYNKTSPPAFLTLTQEQETAYQEVFEHFSAEDFVIPDLGDGDLGDGDGRLTEEEEFYLVSSHLIRPAVYLLAEDLNRVQTYECFLRLVLRECLESRVLTLSGPFSLDSLEARSGV